MKRGILLIAFALLSLVLAQNANEQSLVQLPADVNTASQSNFPLPSAYSNINVNAQVTTDINATDSTSNVYSMSTAAVQNMASQANASLQNATSYAMMLVPQNATQQILAGVAVVQALSRRIITDIARVQNVDDVQANVEHTLTVLYSLNSLLRAQQATDFIALVNASVALQQGRAAWYNMALTRSQLIDTLVAQCNASLILILSQKAQYCNRQNVTGLSLLGLNLEAGLTTNLGLASTLNASLVAALATFQNNITQFYANQNSYYNGDYQTQFQNYTQDYAVLVNNLQQARNLTFPSYAQVIANLTAITAPANLTHLLFFINTQISDIATISTANISCVSATSGPQSTNCTVNAVPDFVNVPSNLPNIQARMEAAMHAVFVGFSNAARLRLQVTAATATSVVVELKVIQAEIEFVRQALQNNAENATLAAADFVQSVQNALNMEIQMINNSGNALSARLAEAAQNVSNYATQLQTETNNVNASLTTRAEVEFAIRAYLLLQLAQAQANQSASDLAQTAYHTYQYRVARNKADYALATNVLNKAMLEGEVRVASAVHDAYQTRVDAQNATMNDAAAAQQYAQREIADEQALAEAYLLFLSRQQVYNNQMSASAQAEVSDNTTQAQLQQHNANVQAGVYTNVATNSQNFQNNAQATSATLIALIKQFRDEITNVTVSWVYTAVITANIVITDIGTEAQNTIEQAHQTIIKSALVLLAQNQNVNVQAQTNVGVARKRQASNNYPYQATVSDQTTPTPSPTPTTSTSTGTPTPTPTPTTSTSTGTPSPTPSQSPSSAVASAASVMVLLCGAFLLLVL